MARNKQVDRNQLQLWLGFVSFFAFMAVFSVVACAVMRIPLDPLRVAAPIVLLIVLGLLYRRYRRPCEGRGPRMD